MNKEQQGIAIAEACGWTAEQDSNGYWRAVNKKNGNAVELWLSEQNVWSVGIPDYLNDLNAMHEAMLLHPRKLLLRNFLYLEVLEDPTNKTNEPAWATAKQWATAYVKSLGKWSE